MNRTIAVCTLLVWAALFVTLVACAPWVLSDENKFFKGFVNEQLLGFMGVIVTITLASSANLFMALTALEERLDRTAFTATKADVKHSAYTLLVMLVLSFVLVIVKPLVSCGHRSEAVVNGLACTIVLVSVMVLIDLTQAAFSLDRRA